MSIYNITIERILPDGTKKIDTLTEAKGDDSAYEVLIDWWSGYIWGESYDPQEFEGVITRHTIQLPSLMGGTFMSSTIFAEDES